jgi:hypothetical protein
MDAVRALEEMAEEAKKIYVEDKSLVLNVVYPYEILLTRANTPEKILGWVRQLSGKTWMNGERLARFTLLAFEQIGVKPDPNM